MYTFVSVGMAHSSPLAWCTGLTPKALYSKAQGRRAAAHPGERIRPQFTPKALYTLERGMSQSLALVYLDIVLSTKAPVSLFNAYGVTGLFGHDNPGCAARPWALEWNAYGVGLELSSATHPRFLVSLAGPSGFGRVITRLLDRALL